MTNKKPVIIIGSGPAGLTAAIYTARANLQPILIQGSLPGGQLTTTTEVENFPGFPEGIMGPELMELLEKQARRFGCEIINDWVTKATLAKGNNVLETQSSGKFESQSIIISTGASAKMLGIPRENELLGFGVSTCATCDGAFFREQEIAVVGGGDSACEEAIFLTRFASKVYLIHRRDTLRASKIMQERATSHPKIEVLWNSAVDELIGEKPAGLQNIVVKNLLTSEKRTLPCTGLFIAVGHTPNTSLFEGQIDLLENKYIKTLAGSTKTNIEGVFACGDVQDFTYRQAITAAGSGCMAALEVERWLETQHS